MNVSLTPELERLVNQKIKSGRYTSATDVIREALRVLEEQDKARKIAAEALKREIAKGIESLERGDGQPLDIEAIKARGRKALAASKKRQKQ